MPNDQYKSIIECVGRMLHIRFCIQHAAVIRLLRSVWLIRIPTEFSAIVYSSNTNAHEHTQSNTYVVSKSNQRFDLMPVYKSRPFVFCTCYRPQVYKKRSGTIFIKISIENISKENSKIPVSFENRGF